MPAAIPLVAAVAGAAVTAEGVGFATFGLSLLNSGVGFSFLGATAFANSIAGFLVSTALSTIGAMAFAPKSEHNNFNKEARTVMVRSSVESHKIIYGIARVSGPIVFIGTTDSGKDANGDTVNGTNVFLHMVIALAGHEIDDITQIYFNDQPVSIDEDGWVTSAPYPYSPNAVTRKITTAIRSSSVTTVTTTVSHGFNIGDIVTTAAISDSTMNGSFVIVDTPTTTTFTYSNGGADSSATGGTAVDQTGSASTSETQSRTIDSIVRDDGEVTVTTSVPHGFIVGHSVLIKTSKKALKGTFEITDTPTSTTFTYDHHGSTLSATDGTAESEVFTSTTPSYARVKKFLGAADQEVSPELLAEVEGWDSTHRLRGIAYVHVRLQYNQKVFSQGIPNISAVVQGKKVYDPRTDTSGWTDNVALCVRDYLTNDYGFNCPDDEVNDDFFISAANVCDESVTLTNGDTQARYSSNGIIDTANNAIDNLNALVAAMAGTVTYVQGQFRAYAGAYNSPVGDIDTDMLAGPVKIRTRPTRQQVFNAVKGTYVDPSFNYQTTDFHPVTNATYATQDGGQTIFKDIQLPLTNDQEAAQRIAKVILEQSRQGIQIEMQLKHHALSFAVWDTITYTDPTFGWSNKVFRIKKVSTNGVGPISLSLQEESSASYDWNSGEATVIDLSPDTNLPDPFTVQPPGSPAVTEELYATNGGALKSKATVTWPASPDVFVLQYQLEYQLTTATDWIAAPRAEEPIATIFDIAPGRYNFRVKAINTLDSHSEYSDTAIVEIYGLTARPDDVQNFDATVIHNAVYLSWDLASDLDVLNGGYVRIRYSSATTTANWNDSVDIGRAVAGNATNTIVPLRDGTYLAKFVDSSDNSSQNAALITITNTSLIELNVVETLSEHPAFAGTGDGVAYDPDLGALKLDGSVTIDDSPDDIDDIEDLDALGGIAMLGTYDFANSIDLGDVYTSKVSAILSVSAYDINSLWDSREENIDDWTDIDGAGYNDFATSPYWYTSSGAFTEYDTLAPDNTFNAGTFIEDISAFAFIFAYDTQVAPTVFAPALGTTEIYVKPIGLRNIRMGQNWNDEFGLEATVAFDLQAGTVNVTTNDDDTNLIIDDYGIQPAANGYYRIWMTTHLIEGYSDGARQTSNSFRLADDAWDYTPTTTGAEGVQLWNSRYYEGPLQDAPILDDVNAALYLRTTNDDPSGTPEWSDWARFFVGDYTARAFEFQARLTSGSGHHNILVNELGVIIDMPDRVEEEHNLTSGTGTYSAAFPHAFRATPAIMIAANNMATGDYYVLSNQDAEGFDIAFKNAGGSGVSRIFDYTAKGYGKLVT